MIEEHVKHLIKRLEAKKIEILKQVLVENDIDPDEYNKSRANKSVRFDPILREQHNGYGELYYYNNGTENGLFLVGFLYPQMTDMLSMTDLKMTMAFDVLYEEPEFNKIPKHSKL